MQYISFKYKKNNIEPKCDFMLVIIPTYKQRIFHVLLTAFCTTNN